MLLLLQQQLSYCYCNRMLIAPRPSDHKEKFNGTESTQSFGKCVQRCILVFSCALNIKPTTENETVWEQTKFGKPSEGASIHTSNVFHTLFLDLVDL